MKTILSLSALLITLTLTAQTNTATWYLNDTSGNGIQIFGAIATGGYSLAMGDNATSSGFNSRALGIDTTASGDYSTAMGYQSTASGNSSFAVGNSTASGDGSIALLKAEASGAESVAIGRTVMAEGQWSIALGSGQTSAIGNWSIALGFANEAYGDLSAAMGDHTIAYGYTSTSMGAYTSASGDYSTSIGFRTAASDYNSLVVGRYNLLGSTVTNSATQFSTGNTAFVIGNGTYDNRSDALTVLFDGTTTIAGDLNINSDKKVFFGDLSFIEGATSGTVLTLNANNNILFRPGGTTTVNFEPNGNAIFNGDIKVTSDKRLKSNIISLGSTLAKLLQIDGKTYTMKKDENKKQKIGVLAQDIEKVFPELVSESNGVKSVNYQGLVPVLINALKEQDTKLNKQQAEINRLKEQEARIERLEKLLLDS